MHGNHTTRAKITATLSTSPWDIHPAQHADFCQWYCSLPTLSSVDGLSDGDANGVLELLTEARNPEGMKTRWLDARTVEYTGKTLEQLNEEALAWLR
jgi:hypothetical protein